jgi:hypothetical protein
MRVNGFCEDKCVFHVNIEIANRILDLAIRKDTLRARHAPLDIAGAFGAFGFAQRNSR